MPTKIDNEKITKNDRVNLRCAKEFKDQLKVIARDKGLKITEYVIGLCESEINKHNGTEITEKEKETERIIAIRRSLSDEDWRTAFAKAKI